MYQLKAQWREGQTILMKKSDSIWNETNAMNASEGNAILGSLVSLK